MLNYQRVNARHAILMQHNQCDGLLCIGIQEFQAEVFVEDIIPALKPEHRVSDMALPTFESYVQENLPGV